jgi:integrase
MSNSRTMVELAGDYLASRRALGYSLEVQGKELLLFARYCDQIGHQGPITADIAIQWARLPQKADPIYWASRLDVVRRFARYRALFESETQIPPPGVLGPTKRRPTPYIYSAEQIDQLLTAAAKLTPTDGLRPHTYAALFGLLACTGLRVSEALSLTPESIDFKNGVISIERTKFHKTRIVPIHPSTVKALQCYDAQRRSHCPLASNTTFFINDKAAPITYRMTLWVFMKIRKTLGWASDAFHRLPTIHCLRHTFAVRRLLQWYEDGVDVNHKILSLSTYLGHVEVADTYWYLTAVPQLLSVISNRFEKFAHQQGDLL